MGDMLEQLTQATTSLSVAPDSQDSSAGQTSQPQAAPVQLHRAKYPWKPSFRRRHDPRVDMQIMELDKSMLAILNKLTPTTLNTLVSQAQSLPIYTSNNMAMIINLVYKKAIDEPMYCAAYAQMCKKVLSGRRVPAPYEPEFVTFRKLIVNRCQAEFERTTYTKLNKDAKLEEITRQADAEKKKELMAIFEEEERKRRMKSVGNIRFISEVYKLQMLTTSIMHRCIRHLITAGDDESLECLCKLLTTIGKDLEMKAQSAGDLGQYFSILRDIVNRRSGPGTVSSRVRFMLQDVIELRDNKWVPRREDANPNTMDQIQKEADRQGDRGGRDMGDRGRKGGNQRGKTNQQFFKWASGSCAAPKGEDKKPAQTYNNPYNVLQDSPVGGDDKRGSVPPTAMSSRLPANKSSSVSTSKAKHLVFEEIAKKSKLVVDELLCTNLIQDCVETVQETFVSSQKHEFVRESINVVLEKSSLNRLNVGRLMCHLIEQNIISVEQFVQGLVEVLETCDDTAIDVPKVWLYLAEFIVPILTSEVFSFIEFGNAVKSTKAVQLIIEVLQLLVEEKGPIWIRERWDKAGLMWKDFLKLEQVGDVIMPITPEQVEDFIKTHNLEYIVSSVSSSQPTTPSQLTMDQIREKIVTFLRAEQLPSAPASFDQVCDWISANVGDRVKEPPFIRALMTAICESAIHLQPNTTTWKLNENILHQHQALLMKYVDNKEILELECIYAVQSLINKLEHPQGLLCAIFQDLYDNSVLSDDAFIAWEDSKDPAEQLGKGVALKSLTSFYTSLKEGESSCDES